MSYLVLRLISNLGKFGFLLKVSFLIVLGDFFIGLFCNLYSNV